MATVMLIDGNSLTYRAFHALPTDLQTSSGQVTNAVFGFTSMMLNLVRDHGPDSVIVAFDRPEKTFRHEKVDTYKANRDAAPDILRQQMGLVRQVTEAFALPILEAPGFEADDIIATLATRAAARGDDVIVVTGDRDSYQLVEDPHIRVLYNRRGVSDYVLYDEAVVGYGPNPRECLDKIMEIDACILGNHDQAALFDPDGFSSGAEKAIFWTRKQIEDGNDPDNQKRWNFLCELPRVHRDGDFLFVHGSARSPLHEYVFPEDIYNAKKIERIFGLIPRYCFQGHTHAPGVFTDDFRFQRPDQMDFVYTLDEKKTMVNVGSVGQPRDGDNRACYVILEERTIHYRRVVYDIDATANKIYAIPELDNFLGDRLYDGR